MTALNNELIGRNARITESDTVANVRCATKTVTKVIRTATTHPSQENFFRNVRSSQEPGLQEHCYGFKTLALPKPDIRHRCLSTNVSLRVCLHMQMKVKLKVCCFCCFWQGCVWNISTSQSHEFLGMSA